MNLKHTPEQGLNAKSEEKAQQRGVGKGAGQGGDTPHRRAEGQDSASRGQTGRDLAGRSAGWPALRPPTKRQPTGAPQTAKDASRQSRIRLPHERDEDAVMTDAAVDPSMAQAAQDLAHGLKDTSRAVETDQTYQRLLESAQREHRS